MNDQLSTLRRQLGAVFDFFLDLYSHPQSAVGTTIVLFFLVLALFGTQLAPYPNANDQSHDVRIEPTISLTTLSLGEHPFGTDRLGRDVLSRVILGTSSIFGIAGFGTLIAVIVGNAVGLYMGYMGGMTDEILGRIIDAMLAVPALLLALVLVGIVGELDVQPNSWQSILKENAVLFVIAVVYVPIVARVVRSSTLDIKTREFVEAAVIRGESSLYIMYREIFPSVIPSLVVEASLRFSYAIFLVASLGFLGFGLQPPSPDWGLMINESSGPYYTLTPWALNYPTLAIAMLVVGVNLMSDGIKRIVQKGS